MGQVSDHPQPSAMNSILMNDKLSSMNDELTIPGGVCHVVAVFALRNSRSACVERVDALIELE